MNQVLCVNRKIVLIPCVYGRPEGEGGGVANCRRRKRTRVHFDGLMSLNPEWMATTPKVRFWNWTRENPASEMMLANSS